MAPLSVLSVSRWHLPCSGILETRSSHMNKYWSGDRLGTLVALDTETEMISHPSMTPRLVLGSASNGESTVLLKNNQVADFLEVHKDSAFIMQNAPFDLAVISKYLGHRHIYELAENDRLWDTKIMYQLIKLAKTGISPQKSNLQLIASEYLGEDIDKDTAVRCNFGQFLQEGGSVNYDAIGDEFLAYAAKDATVTFQVFKKLHAEMLDLESRHSVQGTGLSHKIQLLGAIALDDIQKNGIGFDLKAKELRVASIEAEIAAHRERLASYGWVRGKKGIKKIFEAIVTDLGLSLPRTKTGQISSAADDLAPYVSTSPFVESYVKFHELEKLSTFIREIGTDRIYPKYNLLMNTGRTSSFGPNIQQLPRGGGIRESFIPKEGHVFLDIDYSALELCTLAQHLFREFEDNSMREDINAGKDLHRSTAADIFQVSEEIVSKDERQFTKIANFGFPANMSPATFVEYAKGYGKQTTEEEAADLKRKWARTKPGIRRFWQVGNNTTNVLVTGRIRSKCSYTALLNTYFQGLAADGAKLALYLLWKAGFKTVAFIHDQVLLEVPAVEAERLLPEAQSLMAKGMKFVCPDVLITTEGKVTTCFTK
jgi:DNA polymerase I-like protein with 3'-5' exonuclease and polymerase domains